MNIPDFTKISVLVVGDVMLDRYWQGQTHRISPEAPIPIVHVQDMHERPGGAANVAYNLSVLGVSTHLIGWVGQDQESNRLRKQLEQAGIVHHLESVSTQPTISKLRVLGQEQQIVRLDFEASFEGLDSKKLLAQFNEALNDVQLVILSDYGKGTLAEVQHFIQSALRKKIPVWIDPKRMDVSAYAGADLVTPNWNEFTTIVGACPDQTTFYQRAQSLLEAHQWGALLVTQGNQGMTLFQPDEPPIHLEAQDGEVVDVTGAGDTVIATLGAAFAAGLMRSEAMVLANAAAGWAVRQQGAVAITVPQLRRCLQQLYASAFGIISREDLYVAVADAKAHGERIVFTNGCFDLLHPSHVSFLEHSKALGDRLIVAVNDDASVRRLKGAGRPIYSLTERMHMLASLRSVDWVVSFDEDTPIPLLERLRPDVLVKGKDYKSIDEVVGADQVKAYGGQVRQVDNAFGTSCTTTKLIERLSAHTERCVLDVED